MYSIDIKKRLEVKNNVLFIAKENIDLLKIWPSVPFYPIGWGKMEHCIPFCPTPIMKLLLHNLDNYIVYYGYMGSNKYKIMLIGPSKTVF